MYFVFVQDGSLLRTTLVSHFENASGLSYVNDVTLQIRAVRCEKNFFTMPGGDWGIRTYRVVFKQGMNFI